MKELWRRRTNVIDITEHDTFTNDARNLTMTVEAKHSQKSQMHSSSKHKVRLRQVTIKLLTVFNNIIIIVWSFKMS